MKYIFETKEYERPEIYQTALYSEGFICLSDDVTVSDWIIDEGDGDGETEFVI